MQNEPEAGKVVKVIRRRRTSRHRRNRSIRRVLFAVFCLGLAIGFAGVALPHLSPSLFRASHSVDPDPLTANRDVPEIAQPEVLPEIENRAVYPYSVVPGGVKDVGELKWAAEHDPVVGAHYAGFDYNHARVVVLKATLSAYVSYRIGNKVYWMRKRISLKKGETVITDGKITARTRCANRVEEVPQQATSSSEPPAAKFEEPVHPSTGTAFANPPAPFQSALLNRPALPGLGPAPPLSLYDPFGNGTWVPISPPPLPSICGVGKKPANGIGPIDGTTKKRRGDPCGNGGTGGEVPEPGTWLLFGTGLAAIYWMTRRRFVRS